MITPAPCDRPLLIADDDVSFRETVVEIVAPFFDTIAVDCAEEALQIVSTQLVAVAIFDMHMQRLTGLDAIRWVRKQNLAIPCILMSGDVTPELEVRAVEYEAVSLLRKPPRRQQLLNIINSALEL